MSKIKPKPTPTPAALERFVFRDVQADEDGITGAILFLLSGEEGGEIRTPRIPFTDLPQAAQDGLEAFRVAVWDKAAADNPDAEPSPKAKRKAARDAEKAEADAEKEKAKDTPEIPVVG